MLRLVRIATQAVIVASALLMPGCAEGPAEPQFDSTPVASLQLVNVVPGIAPAIAVGETRQFTVVAKDSAGNIVARPRLEWQLHPMEATVDLGQVKLEQDGRMTGIEQGWVTLRVAAVYGGISAASWVYVRPPVASVRFSTTSVALIKGDRVRIGASALDAANVEIPYGAAPRWTSSNPDVATVDSLGHVQSTGVGRTYIRAVAGERVDSVRVDVRTVRYQAASGGPEHTCGITTANEVVCAGANTRGQLGFFTEMQRFGSGGQYSQMASGGPRVVTPIAMRAVTAGWSHTCSLAINGSAYCWGAPDLLGAAGPLTLDVCSRAFADIQCRLEATPVAGGHAYAAISAGTHYTCGVTIDGRAQCWGRNAGGVLGNGTTTDARAAPMAVAGGITWHSVDAGSSVCGLSLDGVAYCWGGNQTGQLGTGTLSSSLVPVAVTGGLRFSAIGAANGAACGLAATGKVYCWGIATFLGATPPPDLCNPESSVDPTPCALQPVPMELPEQVSMLAVGYSLACALTTTGAVYCWGPFVSVPQRANDVPTIRTIAAGGFGVCGIGVDDIAYCWNSNLNRALAPGQ